MMMMLKQKKYVEISNVAPNQILCFNGWFFPILMSLLLKRISFCIQAFQRVYMV